jgi:hypothetical protein
VSGKKGGRVQIGIKKNLFPLHLQSTTASWDSLLSSLGGRGENNMEHGLENILLKP